MFNQFLTLYYFYLPWSIVALSIKGNINNLHIGKGILNHHYLTNFKYRQ